MQKFIVVALATIILNTATPMVAQDILFVGSFDTPGIPLGIQVVGDLAYVGDLGDGMQIINVSNPQSPSLVGNFPSPETEGVWQVQVVGDLVYMAVDDIMNFKIVNVSNPQSPTFVGGVNFGSLWTWGIHVVGNYAYLGDGSNGLRIVNITNPQSPSLVSTYNTPDWAFGVEVVDSLAYVADGAAGLLILDVSNPQSPTFVGSYNTPHQANVVDVAGDYAFVADGNSGLQIINISNPQNPTLAGSLDTPGESWGLKVVGELVYVADGFSGLRIIDVSNPQNPVSLASYNTSGESVCVDVVGNLIFVGDGFPGLIILSYAASNPPYFSVCPLDFDSTFVNQPVTLSTTLHNPTMANLNVDSAYTTAGFSVTPSGPAVVPPGDSLQLEVTFLAEATGLQTGTLSLPYDSGVVECDLSGFAAPPSSARSPAVPAVFALHQNYPNPFNPVTTISFDLPQPANVLLKIYDVNGRLVRNLYSDQLPAGRHEVGIESRQLTSGIYFYRLQAGAFSAVKRMVVLK